MTGNKAATHEPDEIESFLRILIRRKISFIVTFLLVATLSGGWALRSVPMYAMSFDYEVAVDPMAGTSFAVPGSEGYVVNSDLLALMVESEARKLGRKMAASNPEFSSSSLGRNIDVSTKDGLLRFTIPVTKQNEALALQFESEVIDFLVDTIDSLRSQKLANVEREISIVTAEVAKMAAIMQKPGSDTEDTEDTEEVFPETVRLAEQISDLALLRGRLDRPQSGGLLDEPFLSEVSLGMSRAVKFVLAFFVSFVAATLAAIAMEYLHRATRPI